MERIFSAVKNNSLFLLIRDGQVGFFLAIRDIRRGNPWTTALIIMIISLTFFNMLFVSGILLGAVGGFIGTYKTYYSSNIFIAPTINRNQIEQTSNVISVVKTLPSYKALSARYVGSGVVEYKAGQKLRPTDLSESASGQVVGIDPEAEDETTGLSSKLVAGSFLLPTDADEIMVGSTILQKYATVRNAAITLGTRVLKTADIGSRLRLTVNGVSKDVTIKGVITTNSVSVDGRIYMVDSELRKMLGNKSLNVQEIAITLVPGASVDDAKNYINKNLNDDQVIVQTASEALPAGLETTIQLLTRLGDIVGAIALVVSSVTIFIVIFVNAVTRRKFIGILKGIGISGRAIQLSYIFQALFYAILGTFISGILILQLLVPFIKIHPFIIASLPVILDIRFEQVLPRAMLLIISAFISGLIPAWLVTRQNTLDAILGR